LFVEHSPMGTSINVAISPVPPGDEIGIDGVIVVPSPVWPCE
jgi:hypothetical protein